jgi:hypothetical protein
MCNDRRLFEVDLASPYKSYFCWNTFTYTAESIILNPTIRARLPLTINRPINFITRPPVAVSGAEDAFSRFVASCFVNDPDTSNYDKYLKIFKDHNIDISNICDITDDDLKLIGVDKIGPRMKIRRQITNLIRISRNPSNVD